MGVGADDFLIDFGLSCLERSLFQMYDWGGFGRDQRGWAITFVAATEFPLSIWLF